MDPKGKGMVVNNKEKESIFNEPRDDKPTDSGSSHKKRDENKKRDKPTISNVFLVESLGYNLLSVSQLCNMGYNCLFTNIDVSVFRRSDGSLAFKDVDLDACLIAKTNMGWLWHRRLAHVGMKNLHKLLKGDNVLGLTDVCFEKDRPCAACQAGKQVGSTHHSKNVMTTSRPLELLHMDLFGPVTYLSIGGSKYGLVIVDDFSCFTWVFFYRISQKPKGL
jgi:hypothetical protein